MLGLVSSGDVILWGNEDQSEFVGQSSRTGH